MNENMLFVASTKEVLKYADKSCIEVVDEFRGEFAYDKPFSNYFFHMIQNDKPRTSYHWNFGVITPDQFYPKPNLEDMIDKYLNVGIPGTSIRMVRPPLIITNPEARSEVLEAFHKVGYDKPKDLKRILK